MTEATTTIPLSAIILDEGIYPRQRIDHHRVSLFAENIRDNLPLDPIEVEPHPDKPGKYRILDGAHRWSAYKATGAVTLRTWDYWDWTGGRHAKEKNSRRHHPICHHLKTDSIMLPSTFFMAFVH